MIQTTCAHCSRQIRAADEHAGKKIRCPGCKEVLSLPAAATAVRPQPPPQAPAAIRKAAPPPSKRPPVEEEDEEIAVAEEADDDEEIAVAEEADDDDEPRRRPRKRRKRRRQGEWADCPNCEARGDASRVGFTWWGGVLGPWMFSHVRCNDCGTCYNGRTGKSNNVAIAIYVGVGLVFGVMVGVLALIANIASRH
jgi:phage FluMu protein Com